MGKWLETALVSMLLVFAPIKGAIITTLVLIVADLVAGVWAAKKSGIHITSAGIKRTLGKLLLYEIALCLAFLVQQYLTGDTFPVSKIVSAIVGITELKSILENVSIITGDDVIKKLLDKVVQSKDEIQK